MEKERQQEEEKKMEEEVNDDVKDNVKELYFIAEGARKYDWWTGEEIKWEDYKGKVDQWGFIHENINENNIKNIFYREERTENELNEWIEIWKNYSLNPNFYLNEIKKKIHKGIPNAIRIDIWKKILSFHSLSENFLSFYEETKLKEGGIIDEYLSKDIPRTCRNNIFFIGNFSNLREKIYRVHKGLALFDQEMIYKGGMSFLTAPLLLLMEENDVFFMLVYLYKEMNFRELNIFVNGKDSILQYKFVNDQIFARLFPNYHLILEREASIFWAHTFRFYALLFTDLPVPYFLRIWDLMFIYGRSILFKSTMFFTELVQKKTIDNTKEKNCNLCPDSILCTHIYPGIYLDYWLNFDITSYVSPDQFIDGVLNVNITDEEIEQLFKTKCDQSS